MTFDLHIHGETPEELLDALNHLGGTTNIINASPALQAQSEPVAQLDKPKAQASAKQKKPAQKPAATPAEDTASPTTTASESAHPDPAGTSAAPTSAPSPSDSGRSAPTGTPATTASSEPDPATLDKIRDLARSLIVHGKRAEVQQIIKGTGAASISKLPPDSYTDVWEQLVTLSHEVDSNAAG